MQAARLHRHGMRCSRAACTTLEAYLPLNEHAVLVSQLFLLARLERYGPDRVMHAIDTFQRFLARRHPRRALDLVDDAADLMADVHLHRLLAMVAHRQLALEINLGVVLVVDDHAFVRLRILLLAARGPDAERARDLDGRFLADVGPVAGALAVELAVLDDH